MGYAFLWLEAMTLALLLVAVVFSFSGRLKKWPTLWPILMACLFTLLGIAAVGLGGFLLYYDIHPQWLLPYTLSWTLLFITGCWILILRGRRKSGEVLSAASWPRSKIVGALIITLALQMEYGDSFRKCRQTGSCRIPNHGLESGANSNPLSSFQ